MTTFRPLACLVLAGLPALLMAGPASPEKDTGAADKVAPGDPPPVEETRQRRDRLVEMLRPRLESGRRGAFFLRGAPDDHEGEFRQDSAFYYLTGLDAPAAALVLFFDAETATERLYLPEADAMRERWIGPALSAGRIHPSSGEADARRREAVEASGFRGERHTGVAPDARIAAELGEWLGGRGVLFVAAPAGPDGAIALGPADLPPEEVKLRAVESASEALTSLRLVKSPWEIARIRRAAEISCRAHVQAMDLLRPGIPEYAIEAAIEHAFTSAGARYPAFPTIVGSGPNSCVLHYYRNGRTIGDDEVVLIDIGAEYARYASDVTRTLPSSGRFTASQRKVHDSVLRAQAAGLAAAAPGATLESIDAAVRESLRRDGLEDHTMHGCCHWVGLDVHDVGGRDVPLRPGMVLTVEPGVYIPAEDLGVRIEDTLLVTDRGHEVLSACAPKSAAEIEERIADARRRAARGAEVSPAAPGSPPR